MAVGAALQTTTTAIVSQTTDFTPAHNITTQKQCEENKSRNLNLCKRKGHGSGGRGGGRSSSKSGSSGSSGRGAASSSSSAGGRTTTGSGVGPTYGNGRFYSGSTTTPYRAGSSSTGSIMPFVLADRQETRPVLYGCAPYQVCGCDDNGDRAYIDSIIGNGSYGSLNHSIVCLGDINGTETILINGTLPNGTTASGGKQSPNTAVGLNHRALMWWPGFVAIALMAFG
ncbi:hypothetical protein F5883DRAFT_599127 [Diaporthe sp. PMI_573]|nr:hypothetical protein F5883DRAFT_599127 [Diaporthaceae sp. PMI_573]